jgi:hypothetical protein
MTPAFTPDTVPQQLIDLIDKRAGREHRRNGTVVETLAEVLNEAVRIGALPAAPAAPGWGCPAALQRGYDELLTLLEQVTADRDAYHADLNRFAARSLASAAPAANRVKQAAAALVAAGKAEDHSCIANGPSADHSEHQIGIFGHDGVWGLPELLAQIVLDSTPEPCRFCTQCGRPLDPQDTAAGRRVCGGATGPFIHPGARGFDRSHYFGDPCPGGHFNHCQAPAEAGDPR